MSWRWMVGLLTACSGAAGDEAKAPTDTTEVPSTPTPDTTETSTTPSETADTGGTGDTLPDAADLPAAYEAARRLKYAGCTRTTDDDLAISTIYDEYGWPLVESASSEGEEVFRRDWTYVRVDGRVTESSYVYSAPPSAPCAFTVVSEEAEAEYDEGERIVLQRRRTTDACGDTTRSEWTWAYEIVDDMLVSSVATALGSQATTEYDECAMPVRSVSSFDSVFVNSYEPGTCIPTEVEADGLLTWFYVDGRMDRYETAYSVTNFIYEGCL